MATKKKKALKVNVKDTQPTLVELIAQCGRHYAKVTGGILGFAETAVKIMDIYGEEGKRELRAKWPVMTESNWKAIEQIGRHQLLPQLFLCSRAFCNGILKLNDTMNKQLMLVGALDGGKVEVIGNDGKVKTKDLSELTATDEQMILFAMSTARTPTAIREFAKLYRLQMRKSDDTPKWARKDDCVKILRKFKMTKADWLSIGSTMGWEA